MNSTAESPTAGWRPSPTGCDCDNCRGGNLPLSPFLAPRVTYGMLLGAGDFDTMIGYPRGKAMLHQAWLHGAGVWWGYPVRSTGTWEVRVGPGLAADRIGREVRLEEWELLDLRAVRDQAQAKGLLEASDTDCDTVTLTACVVAEFDGCLSPVPAYANPCDVTRRHDDYSRVLERARISVRLGECPDQCRTGYRRVRVLLGLAKPDPDDERDQQALAARKRVVGSANPARELSCQLQAMACADGIELAPAVDPDGHPGQFPADEDDTAVVVAELTITLRYRDECWGFVGQPTIDECVRTTLLPTDLISALTCGLAPGLLGTSGAAGVEGPRVIGEEITVDAEGRRLTIPVTGRLVSGTVPGSVEVTTLARDKGDRWVVEDVYDTSYAEAGDDPGAIAVRLAYSLHERADDTLVRIRVRGEGGKPVMGADPLAPLAGVVGGPPGTQHEGRDAVWSFEHHRKDDGPQPEQESPPEQESQPEPESTETAK